MSSSEDRFLLSQQIISICAWKTINSEFKNPISDNLMITNCNFKVGSAPHPCISTKWKKYSKKILENGHNIIMNEFFG